MEKVKSLIKEVQESLTHASASRKDEVRVMRAFLNDTSYEVGVYDKNGKCGTIKPAEIYRNMLTNIVSATAKISKEESKKLVNNYEVRKSDAEDMLVLNKEFFNTYLQTGRKIGFGGREKSNISFTKKEYGASVRSYPKQNTKGEFERAQTKVPAYDSVKVHSPCPTWVKNKKK